MRTQALRRPVFLAAAILALFTLVFLAAGTWQLQRARYKDGLQRELQGRASEPPEVLSTTLLEASAVNFRRMQATGLWLADKTILLDNKVREGVVGYEVLTPLRIGGGVHVLVNRGWIRAPLLRSELPVIGSPSGQIALQGVARAPSNRFIELDARNINGMVWQNLTMERYAAWSGLKLQPFVLYQEGNEGEDGLMRVQPAPEAMGINADRHRGYALTWYLLAAVTVVLGIAAWFSSRKKT